MLLMLHVNVGSGGSIFVMLPKKGNLRLVCVQVVIFEPSAGGFPFFAGPFRLTNQIERSLDNKQQNEVVCGASKVW